jgi:GNAT superfamily N-acetyltransferase
MKSSVRGLQADDYSQKELEGAIDSVYGVDTQLILDGTYFVAEAIPEEFAEEFAKDIVKDATVSGPIIVACGGWSKRKTLYGADHFTGREDTLLDPQTDQAKIRAFFVHPDWARQGIGTLLLEQCEAAAQAAGFKSFEMGATLTGVPMYKARGYEPIEELTVPLNNGEALAIVKMQKRGTAL